MYSIVAGAERWANVARSLLTMGHEVTLIEQRPYRFEQLQDEFEHQVLLGDATELHVLERAGIARPRSCARRHRRRRGQPDHLPARDRGLPCRR